jgi:hypothetical protein
MFSRDIRDIRDIRTVPQISGTAENLVLEDDLEMAWHGMAWVDARWHPWTVLWSYLRFVLDFESSQPC